MSTIHWGIIGCGEVTEVKSGPALQQARDSQLVAVMRRNGALAEDYARRHQVPKWYDNGEKLINDPDVDAIYIATPPGSHMDYVLMAAQAGKPVYVEKPMARNLTECQQMIAACQTAGVPLFVAYYRRALERFLKVKALLESKAIGEIRFVTSVLSLTRLDGLNSGKLPWQLEPSISGGGWFMDMICHNLDLLDFFFGPITSVQGNAANQAHLYPAEDFVGGSFTFASGVHGIGAWSFVSHNTLDRTEIFGDRGIITFSTWGSEPVLLTTPAGTESFDIGYPVHVQLPLIQTIVDELNGTGKSPSNAENGARTAWVMDEFLKEYRPLK